MTFQYDVAFSFVAQDEPLATELNDLLQGRLSTFLYSKKQEKIAGADGEERFNAVFGQQARVVVVLYRAGWGESPWTRIEETAIRNRAFDHGYDFVKFIPLDEPPVVPKWLPRTQLWIGLKRWGTAAAASVIEARVQELGGEPRDESVADKAARVQRSIQFAERRKQFLHSYEGVSASNAEFGVITSEVQSQLDALKNTAPSFQLSLKSQQRRLAILGRGPAVHVYWNYHFANSLDDAHLEVTLWRGHPPWPGVMHWEQPQELQRKTFTFDLLPTDEYRWVSSAKEGQSYSSKDLASYILGYTIEQTGKYHDR
jgi:hypothetical protein